MKKLTLLMLLFSLTRVSLAQSHFCGVDTFYNSANGQKNNVLRTAALKEILKWRDTHKGDFNRYKSSPSNMGFGSSGCEQSTFYLPVVVHIIHLPGDTTIGQGTNISNAQVENAIELLNRGFGNAGNYGIPAVNTGIKFCLATRKPDGSTFTGIIRKASSHSNHIIDDLNRLKSISSFPSSNYINIYVVNNILSTDSAESGILGYASFPEIGLPQDGVVMRARYFGDYQTCTSCNLNIESRGRILVHEMGHYLGVYHPFQNKCSGNKLSTCSNSGDYCCDVPQIKQPTTSCNTLLTSDCYNPQVTVQIHNFMDYTPDACAWYFTNNQADLMAASLNTIRRTLITQQNLDSTGVQCCVRTAWFSSSHSLLCLDSAVELIANKYIGHEYYWKIFRNDTLITTLSDTSGIHEFQSNKAGNYSVGLEIVQGIDTLSQFRTNLFYIGDCTKRLKSHNGNWYFGDHAGVQFKEFGPIFDYMPRFKSPNINNTESSVNLSDSMGNLLFYSGKKEGDADTTRKVFKNNYIDMDNPLVYGHESSAQGGVAFKVPFSNSRYYLITTGDNYNGFVGYKPKDVRYNIIDMDSALGYGNVLWNYRNKPIVYLNGPDRNSIDSCLRVNESVAAVPSCNDSFYWVALIGRDKFWITTPPAHWENRTAIMIFKATPNGIVHQSSTMIPYAVDAFSHITFSMDGRQIGNPYFLGDFDPATGQVSRLRFNLFHYYTNNETELNESCFSPDGSKLYYLTASPDSINNVQLMVVDVLDKNPFLNPQKVMDVPCMHGRFHGLQLGPDKKMYLGIGGTEYLSAINNPNEPLNRLDINITAVYLGNGNYIGKNQSGLPNNIEATKETVSNLSFIAVRDGCLTFTFKSVNNCESGTAFWNFGDGQNDTGNVISHVYSAYGEYEVTMKIGTDSISKTVITSSVASQLAGDTLICDTSSSTLYTMPHRAGVTYAWTATNGVVTPFDNEALVKWNDTIGTLKLVINDAGAGCIDSTTIQIHKVDSIYNNIISLQLNTCNVVNDSFIVTGNKAGGIGATPNYYWYWKGPNDTSWKTPYIEIGSVGRFRFRDSIFQLMRVAQGGQCFGNSNIVSVPKFKITNILQKENGDCNPGYTDPFNTRASGYIFNPVYIVNPTQKYKIAQPISVIWQFSKDSINWYANQIDSIEEHNYSVTTFDSFLMYKKFYLRRALECGDYTSYSNMLVFERPYFQKLPSNQDLCYSNQNFMDSVGMNWSTANQKSFSFQIYNNGWSQFATSTNGKSVNTFSLDTGTYLYRVVARFNGCDSVISDTVNLRIGGGAADFTATSGNFNAGSGIPISLVATRSNYSNYTYVMWQRSRNPIGGVWDSIGVTKGDTFVVTPTFDNCQPKWYYRAVLRNICPASGKNFLTSTVKSKSIEAGSYQYGASYGDYWIPDTKRDIGAEPNWIDTNAYTQSNWVWNRDVSNKLVPVNDWLDRSPIHCDADTNFIHVIIRNNGNDIAQGGKLYTYWTVNSTNEDWNGSWDGSYKFYNLDTGSSFYGQKKPVGGRINKLGIDIDAACVAQHGYPYLDAKGGMHDSVIVTYPWIQSDTVPKPGWYYHSVGNQKLYSNNIGLCILARIQTCQDQAYGMSYPEKLNKDSTYSKSSGNIGYNISRNNNIASANFYLDYVKPPFESDIDNWTLNAVSPLTEDSVTERLVEWVFCADDARYFNNAEVYVTIPDLLWNYFSSQSMPGSGWIPDSDNHIIITDPCAVIGPLSLPDTIASALGFTWRFKPGFPMTGTAGKVLFELVQKTDAVETGRTYYGLQTVLSGSGEHGGDAPIMLPEQQHDSTNSIKGYLKISPNPFTSYLDINYHCAADKDVKIEILNVQGQLVKIICNCKSNANGDVFVIADLLDFAEGTYIVRVYENGKFSTEKVVHSK